MAPSCSAPLLLTDAQLNAVHGGMFAPFVSRPFNPSNFARKPASPPPPPVTQGLGKAMVKGAVLGGLAGAPTGTAAPGAVGGALLGGMDHCLERMRPLGPGPVPTNLNIVARVHPSAYRLVRQM